MIKKLKVQFVIINIVIVMLLLAAVFIMVYAQTYQKAQDASISALRNAISNHITDNSPVEEDDEENVPIQNDHRGIERNNSQYGIFLVSVDANGALTEILTENAAITDAQALADITAKAMSSPNTNDIIDDEGVRFLKEEINGKTLIAFADRTSEINTLQNLITTSLITGSISLIAVILISLLFASWAIKPVARSLEQQRQFVADASHELRTPLTTILANTDIMLAKPQESIGSQSKWLEYIKTEAQRMSHLLADMLFLAKTDDAKQAVILSEVNLCDVVTHTLLTFESVVYEKERQLESEIAPEIMIEGDAERIRQLLMILLDNAVKYSDEHGTITVKLSKEHDKAKLSVANTGTPIDAKHQKKIFERFYRTDESRARDSGGSGLGLAIAKSIADAHHAKIWVSYSQTEGNVFTVTFPLTKKKHPA